MQINVPGCLLDGSTPATTTPVRTDINLYQGVDTVIQVTVTGANGAVVNITGYTGVLALKDRVLPTSGTPTTSKTYNATLTNPAAGIMQFTIPGIDVKNLSLVGYWWDVFVTNAGKRDEVVLTGTATVNMTVGA
jgi:hypothetical protein